ncbi:MAG: TRAP transporter small permease [Treponemataceae bacterium]
MTFSERFDGVVKKLNKVNEILMIVTILIMFVVLLAQVGSRFIFFIPLPSSQDIIIYFLIACVFFGIGSAVSNDKMIAIDILTHYLPEKPKNAILLVADLVSIAFSVILINQGLSMMEKTKDSIIGASPFTVNYYYLLVVVGCAVMCVNYVNNLFKRIAILSSGGGKK